MDGGGYRCADEIAAAMGGGGGHGGAGTPTDPRAPRGADDGVGGMRLVATAIVLAGAMVAGAVAWHGRTRIIPVEFGYVWEDRWTGAVEVCTARGAFRTMLLPAAHDCVTP